MAQVATQATQDVLSLSSGLKSSPVDLKTLDHSHEQLPTRQTAADRQNDDEQQAIQSVLDIQRSNVTHIISSPYPETGNQLNTQSLETPSLLLAYALTALEPIRSDYATAPYLSSFNWSNVFAAFRALCDDTGFQWQKQDFYLVIFRSKLREGADRGRLGELDQHSHEEACASGGLLKYWFGSPDPERRNLATCIWRNRQDAALGGRGPWHAKARGSAREMYDSITFETYRFVVEDGAEKWSIEDFKS